MKKILLLPFLFLLLSFSISKKECENLIYKGVEEFGDKNYKQSLVLLTKARDEALTNNWSYLSFLAINNIGNNYYSMLDYGEALEHYLKAYTIAIKQLSDKEEMIVLNNISVIYSEDKEYDKAEEYLDKAYKIAVENELNYNVGLYSINLGEINTYRGNRDLAQLYFKKAITLLEANPSMQKKAKIAYAKNLIYFKKFQEVEELLNQIANKNNSKLSKDDVKIKYLLAKTYFNKGKNKEALGLIKPLLLNNEFSDVKIDIYNLLSDIYFKEANYKESIEAKNKAHSFYVKTENKTKKQILEKNKIRFELENSENKLRENQIKMNFQKKVFIICIVFGGIIVVFLVYTIKNIEIKNKQSKSLLEKNQKILELELKEKESDNLLLEQKIQEGKTKSLLEKERLKNVIETRNRELSAKALYWSSRNELLSNIIKNFEKEKDFNTNEGVTKQVKKLKELTQTDDEWSNFIKHFEEVNQGVLSRLKKTFPDLNKNDIRFISYVYMNLSSKEIASVFNITPAACRKRKERICKKMKMDNKANLFEFLSNF